MFSGQGMGISTCKIMSINMKQNRITCAIVDAELKLAEFIQFDDDERCTQLESILVQNQVREAISCGQLKPNASKALERTGVTCSALKSTQFEVPTHDRQNAIFAKGSTDTEEHYAMCVNAACHYLKLSDKPNLKTRMLDMSRFLRLDSSAKLNLHLDSSQSSEATIAKTLSAGCTTAQGSRVIRRWLAQPLTQLDLIQARDYILIYV